MNYDVQWYKSPSLSTQDNLDFEMSEMEAKPSTLRSRDHIWSMWSTNLFARHQLNHVTDNTWSIATRCEKVVTLSSIYLHVVYHACCASQAFERNHRGEEWCKDSVPGTLKFTWHTYMTLGHLDVFLPYTVVLKYGTYPSSVRNIPGAPAWSQWKPDSGRVAGLVILRGQKCFSTLCMDTSAWIDHDMLNKYILIDYITWKGPCPFNIHFYIASTVSCVQATIQGIEVGW